MLSRAWTALHGKPSHRGPKRWLAVPARAGGGPSAQRSCLVRSLCQRAMDVTKPYEFIGFGAMDVTKPYEFIGFGAESLTDLLT